MTIHSIEKSALTRMKSNILNIFLQALNTEYNRTHGVNPRRIRHGSEAFCNIYWF